MLRQIELAAATRPRARAAATCVARRPASITATAAGLPRETGDGRPKAGGGAAAAAADDDEPARTPPAEVVRDTTAAVTSANRCSSCSATSPVEETRR